MTAIITRLIIFLAIYLPSTTVLAEDIVSGFNFHPTPGDVSMVFLGNIFGVVDGVLSGSGSQIVGEMFAIFNSAVLSLGGIILLYTLFVSSLNTAHEGQLLGQKWSSVWVPIRSTVGIALLLPKASGYCMMQIFVMWVVVQGVGAADKIWSAALGYLNRGGAIVQRQMPPSTSVNAGNGKITNVAMAMLSAQVCMKTIEFQVKKIRKDALAEANGSSPSGKCVTPKDDKESNWYKFCNTSVPDFLNSVDIPRKGEEAAESLASTVSVDLPSFDSSSVYSKLNGLCGKLTWSMIDPSNMAGGLSASEKNLVKNTRSIALYQMYMGLLPVSNAIINNAADFNTDLDCSTDCAVTNLAPYPMKYRLGTPLTINYEKCSENVNYCVQWGNENGSISLLNGTELQDAVAAYNGIMLPVLTSAQLKDDGDYSALRSFIREAESKGWMMAGAYFFRLAILNSYVVSKTQDSPPTDNDSNLSLTTNGSTDQWDLAKVKEQVTANETCNLDPFCLGIETESPWKNIAAVFNDRDTANTSAPKRSDHGPLYGPKQADTVYGYLKNANILQLPGQSTTLNAGLTDDNSRMSFNPSQSIPKLGPMSFSGGKWGIAGSVATLLFNGIVVPIWNLLLSLMMPLVMQAFSAMMQPIFGMAYNIFNQAMDVMRLEGVNPIIALANMGTSFIDGVGNAFMVVIATSAVASTFPPGLALIMMVFPIVLAWMSVMLGVGFSCAYYIPFVPFMVFAFASIGWLIGVIEGMVAAPIVALGLTHPEGHEAFGKAEQALMLLLSMFLRPAMMILGYIFGIILSYVGIWVMNQGFNLTVHDIHHMTPITKDNITPEILGSVKGYDLGDPDSWSDWRTNNSQSQLYGFWSKLFLFFFTILTYTSLYVAVVQKAFSLIYYLPDKVLRWLSGGVTEQLGEGAAQGMQQEVKSKTDSAGQQSSGAMAKFAGEGAKRAGAGMKEQLKKEKGKGDSGSIGGGGSNPAAASGSAE